MASPKKKAKTKTVVKFRDLKAKTSPKGGFSWGAKIEDPTFGFKGKTS